MLGAGHRAVGASWGLTFGMVAGLPAWQTVAAAGISSTFAAGRWLSPDVDQHPLWRIADDLIPDEWLDRYRIPHWTPGKGGPLQHRGASHWWGWQLMWAVVIAAWWPPYWWILAAVVTGWTSHIFADFLWGMGHPESGRPGGVPMAPWWGHIGLEWDVGGAWEKLFTRVVMPVVLFGQGLWLVGLGPRVVDVVLAGG